MFIELHWSLKLSASYTEYCSKLICQEYFFKLFWALFYFGQDHSRHSWQPSKLRSSFLSPIGAQIIWCKLACLAITTAFVFFSLWQNAWQFPESLETRSFPCIRLHIPSFMQWCLRAILQIFQLYYTSPASLFLECWNSILENHNP